VSEIGILVKNVITLNKRFYLCANGKAETGARNNMNCKPKMHKIQLVGEAAFYPCDEDTVALSSLENGRAAAVRVGCRRGGCGACRVRVISGAYTTKKMSRAHVSEADKQDGYDIAFVRHDKPGKLHHLAFYLEDWNDVGHAVDIMTLYNVSRDVGPTRHGITRGQTIYFFDPSGNRNEVFAGGYTAYKDHPTRVQDGENIGRGIFYYERQLNDAFLSVVT
jgi:ferredoxin